MPPWLQDSEAGSVATSVDAGDLAVEVGDPVRADLDESSVAFVSNGDDSKIVDGAVGDAADRRGRRRPLVGRPPRGVHEVPQRPPRADLGVVP